MVSGMREKYADSDVILKHVPLIGTAIREKYHWVPLQTPLYLATMDNDGCHVSGTHH